MYIVLIKNILVFPFFNIFFFSVPVYNVEAVVGDPVYLPCDISTKDPSDQVVLVLWYREDLGTPIYT